jgi:hypothetical protein
MTPLNERPTPLTDAEASRIGGHSQPSDRVSADFARTLERSLAERTEERDTANTAYRMAKENQELLIAKRDTALAKLDRCREALERLEEVGILCQRAEESRYSDARIFARQTLEETK